MNFRAARGRAEATTFSFSRRDFASELCCKPRSRILPQLKRGCSAGRRRSRGRATRANVATRSRFGRGARHRTIRLREPPASGALRLPALHRGFSLKAGRPASAWKPHSLPSPGMPPGHGLYRARFDSRYVTDIRTNVKSLSLTKIRQARLRRLIRTFMNASGRRHARVPFAPKADNTCIAAKWREGP